MLPYGCPSDRLERGVLLTVLYSDLFGQALTFDELLSYMVEPAEPNSLRRSVDTLVGVGWLEQKGNHLTWKDRSDLVDLRRERQDRSSSLWPSARKVARSLATIPFLRMVGVCGSLAVENVPEGGDIDLFLVTEEDRLWIVHLLAMSRRRQALRKGIDICPNYLLTLANLEVRRRDLHTAREIAHVVPLWGESTYELFLAANRWIYEFLPNLDLGNRRRFLLDPPPPTRGESLEGFLRGQLGNFVDRLLHRALMVYYPLRLRSRGVHREQIRNSYQRNRQEVVGGGYALAIRERYLKKVHTELGEVAVRYAEQKLFPTSEEKPDAVPLYGRQLAERYGSQE